jgi:hypothetical protein
VKTLRYREPRQVPICSKNNTSTSPKNHPNKAKEEWKYAAPQGLVVQFDGGGEKKGIVGIVVGMVGIEGIVVGMVGNGVAGRGGSVGNVGTWVLGNGGNVDFGRVG